MRSRRSAAAPCNISKCLPGSMPEVYDANVTGAGVLWENSANHQPITVVQPKQHIPRYLHRRKCHMKTFFRRFICNLVIPSLIVLPYSAQTQAALIGTDQAVARVQAQSERVKLPSFVARADGRGQLAALGGTGAAAPERVNALTDDEG